MALELIEVALNVALPLLLIVVAYFVGRARERRHYGEIRRREEAAHEFLTVTFPYVPERHEVVDVDLFTGSVVISIDHFKRFLAGLRNLVGGRVTSYETLLDRARREAVLRMQDAARAGGYDAVVNVRLETSRLASRWGRGNTTAGVEVLAFGTGLKLEA